MLELQNTVFNLQAEGQIAIGASIEELSEQN